MKPDIFGLTSTNTKPVNSITATTTGACNYTNYNPYAELIESLPSAIYIDTDSVHCIITGGAYNKKKRVLRSIKKVIFNNPATIVFWRDGTKTIVKCGEDEVFDAEKGLAMAIAKHALGNDGVYYEVFKKWLPSEDDKCE